MSESRVSPLWRSLVALSLLAAAGPGCAATKVAGLIAQGDSRTLRKRPEGAPASSPGRPSLLVLALDGVGRDLLYDAVRKGEMPALAALLGGQDLAHAHLDETLISTMPSSTIPGWVTAFTGATPSHHGITGNEFFVRERREMAAPVPTTFTDPAPVISCYTDSYIDTFRAAPSVYERMRQRDPDVLIWVAMHQFFPGADRLLLTPRKVLVDAVRVFAEEQIEKHLNNRESRKAFQALDENVVGVVLKALDDPTVPDVLTVYLSGTDQYAHIADEGPDPARTVYLREVVDPLVGKLADKLRQRGALDNRYVVVTADHGHTEVLRDDAHALSMKGVNEPPEVVKKARFRVRPFRLKVDKDDDFQAVLAYQGAVAYVYAADRSTCPDPGKPCDWSRPPRMREDVLPLADAFFRNNLDGSLSPGLKGTLDMVLAREPRPQPEDDRPFEVYVGDGQLMPIGAYLETHPHPDYIDLEARLRDLAVGPLGERAGDVLLLAHNGDRASPGERFYFASLYRSWHGSPSRKDSEIPLILAHPTRSSRELGRLALLALGEHPRQQKFADLLVSLREPPP